MLVRTTRRVQRGTEQITCSIGVSRQIQRRGSRPRVENAVEAAATQHSPDVGPQSSGTAGLSKTKHAL